MKRLLIPILIGLATLIGGCTGTENSGTNKETKMKLPETIAVQDEFTRSFLVSTDEVAVAGVSIAASAFSGAKIGALVGVAGGPLGLAITEILSEVKIMDVNNDGEADSIGDAIKTGKKGMIDNVSSWFKG